MTIGRKYITHGNQRIYFEDNEVQTEVLCVECSAEISRENVHYLMGHIDRYFNAPPIQLNGPDGSGATLHSGCITLYISKQLAGLQKPVR